MSFFSTTKKPDPSINIVCMANYCRSPVAEYLLEKELNGNIKVSSSGLNPFPNADMDPRSREFLENKGINVGIHTPKRIDNIIARNSSLILALDIHVLRELNNQFTQHRKKIRLFSFLEPKINLSDPYRSGNEEYSEIMKKIDNICANYSKDFYFLASELN